MGSLKDEMRGLREDHKPCEKAEDGQHPCGSDGDAVQEEPQINTSQESTSQEDCESKPNINASYNGERDKSPITKDQELSGGVCDNAGRSDSIGVKDSEKTNEPTAAAHNDMTISNKFLSDRDEDGEIQVEKDKIKAHDREKEPEIENILVPVPATPGPSDPWSPAPAGQHHMRTQVSLEVVQCCSAATSPMTPPEGGHSFFFPSSFGRSGSVGTGTKDAELQVGQQVEFCSVATSPMTPKTPSTTAFPELIGTESWQKVKKSEGQRESGQQDSFPVTKSPAEAESEISRALKFTTSKESTEDFSSNASPEISASCQLRDSQVTQKDSNQQCKQPRMGSMDQDITILVTHYDNNEEKEEETTIYLIEPDMVKIDEHEELRESNGDVKRENRNGNISTETAAPEHTQDTSDKAVCDEAKTDMKCEKSEVKDNQGAHEQLRDVSMTKPSYPESPAPFGCHNIRTQVSLEVVQCQSAATSPMTPPEGDQAFYFPSSFGTCAAVGTETKDAELQVGQQVEFRSVATAPMTPRTPTTTTFPEIRKEASTEEKIVEEEEDKKEQEVENKEEVVKEEEEVTKEKKVEAAKEDTKEDGRNCKEKSEEPVQEVSWDEKGMTWEVYGAVVEVTVLGSAIQKHLEKQVKKRQPSMPPPPPLNPSAMPLSSESTRGGSGKSRVGKRGEQDGEVTRRRRNPFRLMMENIQQPHCCSKAHTTE
ncbi:G protein-regulated inducer of neurite outgrowth 1 [Larimichthys crocea]|uniref:G protein-regulated inducer of neurite outgrowth 1 n=1 Tax=Larimichthys crocea TaxID=215358 RepID=UPI000F5D5315|nr:G protein-regulated inducer of neurite outgrowth 1 [Larimichthys crocea]